MRLNRIKETLVTLACLAVSGIALMAGMWIALDMPPRTTVAPAIAVAEIGVGEVR